MIVLINGSFGVGKTSVATELVKRLPNSHLYDPEIVGMALRYLTEGLRVDEEDSDDFQDIALWRTMTVGMAARLQQQYGRDLVVPMTIVRDDYFTEIVDGLRQIDDVRHFSLVASAETINERLRKRGEKDGQWVFQQVARCVAALQSPQFKTHIDTENRTVEQITTTIIGLINKVAQ